MKLKKSSAVYFYNSWHNGDLHVCRGLIRFVVDNLSKQNYNYKFYYGHEKAADIVSDIPNLIYDNKYSKFLKSMQNRQFFYRDDALFFNTWYGCHNMYYYKKYGPTFDCIYSIFETVCKSELSFDLNSVDPKELFPKIDFNDYKIAKARRFIFERGDKKRVFISNGETCSAQSDNSNLNGLIIKLATKYKNVDFYLSNEQAPIIDLENVIYSSKIINKQSPDLNETAYVSTKCDVIVGRASGPYTFALNYENIFNRDCEIVCFSSFPEQNSNFWVGNRFINKIKYKANSVNYKTNDHNVMFDKISEAIDKKIQ